MKKKVTQKVRTVNFMHEKVVYCIRYTDSLVLMNMIGIMMKQHKTLRYLHVQIVCKCYSSSSIPFSLSKSQKYFILPKLSPSMISGKLEKYHVKLGQAVQTYDLFVDVSTNSLTIYSNEESNMQIEIVECDMFVVKLLCNEGDIVETGTPIAILSEDISDIDNLQIPPIRNKDIKHQEIAMWQGYMKSKSESSSCGCS